MSTVTIDEMMNMVGENLGSSEWITVDQDMINKFADATGDHQFIHVNEEAAKMIEMQKHFDAAARLIRTADEILDTVINIKRY